MKFEFWAAPEAAPNLLWYSRIFFWWYLIDTASCFIQDHDEEEHFTDVLDDTIIEDINNPQPRNDISTEQNNPAQVTPSQGHVFVDQSYVKGYQANARNPLYSGAGNSCLWEVTELSRHYHPSVSRFAENILQVCILRFRMTSQIPRSSTLKRQIHLSELIHSTTVRGWNLSLT